MKYAKETLLGLLVAISLFGNFVQHQTLETQATYIAEQKYEIIELMNENNTLEKKVNSLNYSNELLISELDALTFE